jgi:hypothetical protein
MSGGPTDWDAAGPLDELRDWYDQRIEEKLRELGTREPSCSATGCDETDPLALYLVSGSLLCYEHLAERHGRGWTEAHHWAGRRNDEQTDAIPANDHRVLSELQTSWPRETLRNADGSPLLQAAAAIRGWLDLLTLLIARVAGWVPPFLEWLDVALRASIGERWWDELGWTEQ